MNYSTFSFIWFFVKKRNFQENKYKKIRNYIRRKIHILSILYFISLFNNNLFNLMMFVLGAIGLFETFLLLNAIFSGLFAYVKYRASKRLLW